ncbi:MAG: UTP--glucose-1-phosphate uridylyltransferase, partial [Myxococcota bacterium]|nr:UTP--glucose-1-phosphate uridylyltransferase [Myxococcota bacterium]
MSSPSPLDSLRPDELERLEFLDFDADLFGRLADTFRSDRMPPNEVEGQLDAPSPEFFRTPAPLGTMQGDALLDAGLQFLDGGRAGLVLLNGGMATRFGGQVKAIVEALPGQSFLGLQAKRLASLHRSATRASPLLLMNSFATEGPTRE